MLTKTRRIPELIAEITHSEHWLETLTECLNSAHVEDLRHALVTDCMGVEVRPYDRGEVYLDVDRFPVKVFFLGAWTPTSSAKPCSPNHPPRLERALSVSSNVSFLSWASAEEVSPVSREGRANTILQFTDVWPGILRIKLGAVAGRANESDALRSVYATDATGIEVDICSFVDRMPELAQFPLKLHFRAQGPRNLRQNLEDHSDSTQSQNSHSWEEKDYMMGRKSSMEREFQTHSTELTLESILPDVINARLKDLGITMTISRRLAVLVTDRIGVQVYSTEGVPASSRFPLKFHVDESVEGNRRLSSREQMGGPTMTYKDVKEWGERKRVSIRRGLSKLSGNG